MDKFASVIELQIKGKAKKEDTISDHWKDSFGLTDEEISQY